MVLFGNTALASPIIPFSTLVKQSFSWSVGVPMWTVLVTSVVPSLYWAPLSHRYNSDRVIVRAESGEGR